MINSRIDNDKCSKCLYGISSGSCYCDKMNSCSECPIDIDIGDGTVCACLLPPSEEEIKNNKCKYFKEVTTNVGNNECLGS